MANHRFQPCRVWELIPVKVHDPAPQPSTSFAAQGTSSAVPPYEERPGNHCCSCSHVTKEPVDDGYGTTVVEVTTVTTRKKYRVEE